MFSEGRIFISPATMQSVQIRSRNYCVLPAVSRKNVRQVEDDHDTSLRGTECILMVDDERSLRDVAEYALSRLGYKVMVAPDGEKALQLYREKKNEISLIVLDLIMPGMGGKCCLEQLLEMDPAARVVVVSGYADEQPSGGFLEIGAKGFVTKPYDMKDLTRVIRKLLDCRS